MSMSTYVKGFRPPDKKWKEMKAVWDACEKADIEKPDEVLEFFGHDEPDDSGVEVNLEKDACCKEFDCDGHSGFEIEVSKLPKDIKIVRFYNSW